MAFTKEHYEEYKRNWRKNRLEKDKQMRKEYYQENKDKIKQYQKEYRKNNKEKIKKWRQKTKTQRKEYKKNYYQLKANFVLEYKKDKKCINCGYKEHPEILQFHHTKGDKSFSVGSGIGNKKNETIKKEMDKCILLCPNCHFLLHFKKEDKKNILI
jgi:hypothetical protein